MVAWTSIDECATLGQSPRCSQPDRRHPLSAIVASTEWEGWPSGSVTLPSPRHAFRYSVTYDRAPNPVRQPDMCSGCLGPGAAALALDPGGFCGTMEKPARLDVIG